MPLLGQCLDCLALCLAVKRLPHHFAGQDPVLLLDDGSESTGQAEAMRQYVGNLLGRGRNQPDLTSGGNVFPSDAHSLRPKLGLQIELENLVRKCCQIRGFVTGNERQSLVFDGVDHVGGFALADKPKLVPGKAPDVFSSEETLVKSRLAKQIEELEHERLTTVSLPMASPWLGRTVLDLNFHAMGVRLVNLRRASGKNEPVNDQVELQIGDTLVLSGNARALALAEEKLLRG